MNHELSANNYNALSLPDEIGNSTVNELMRHPDTDVIKHGNRVSLRRRSEYGVATLEFTSYDTGRRTAKMSSVPNRERKKDFTEDIIAMKQDGMRQKDIAFELGISESYVSRILRQKI